MFHFLYFSIVLGPVHWLHERWCDDFHRSHSPPSLIVSVAFHFISELGPRTDQRPKANLLASRPTSSAFAEHIRSLSLSPQSMSLYIDMKIILPGKYSGSQTKVFSNFWISRRICNVVYPGNIIHSNSTGSPSIPSNSLYCFVLLNHCSLPSHSWLLDYANSFSFPTHKTESGNT